MVKKMERKTGKTMKLKTLFAIFMVFTLAFTLWSDTLMLEAYASEDQANNPSTDNANATEVVDVATAKFYFSGTFKLLITDGENVIKDAQVELLSHNKEVIETFNSGDDGKVIQEGLLTGTYYYRITSVPDKYVLDNTETKFVINQSTWLVKKIVVLEEKIVKNYSISTESDLRTLSNLSEEDYEKMLEDTALAGIGDALVKAEEKYGVNGLYLLGLACLESGYGSSYFARDRHNLVGWGAYDSNPNAAMSFESKDECILHVAQKLKENYLTKGGSYFEGYTARAIDVHYCSDPSHAQKIVAIVQREVEEHLF